MFADRNFSASCVLGFFLGVVLFGVLALLPPMLENLLGYPVVLTGLISAPRGFGTLLSTMVVGRVVTRVDSRVLIGTGLAITAYAMAQMSHYSLGMDEHMVITAGFVQGIGTGLIFTPLSVMAFATLPGRFRNEAAALFTLIRNIGSAIGISALGALTIRNTVTVHARLAEGIRADNPMLAPAAPWFDPAVPGTVARLEAMISRQAAMVSYTDAFHLLLILTALVLPMVLVMRPPRRKVVTPALHMD